MTVQETREPGQPVGARWPGGRPRPVLGTLAVLGLAGYAWVASGLPPFSGRALLGVLIPGAAIGLIAYGRPTGAHSRPGSHRPHRVLLLGHLRRGAAGVGGVRVPG